MKSCKRGSIYRKSYTRKTKSGKRIRVRSGCIKSRSAYGVKRSALNKRIMTVIKSRQRKASARTPKVKCPRGKIARSAYMRSGYTKKSGARVKPTVVAEGCIRDVGKRGKGEPAIGPLMEGSLKDFGYTDVKNMTKEQRHKALKKAMKAYGDLSVLRKLNAVYVLNTRTNPALSKIFLEDRDWVMKVYQQ